MSEDSSNQNAFQIHQGSYLNARLNKLLTDIDRYSLSPNTRDKETGYENYKLLMRSLTSVAVAIYGEVTDEERETLKHGIDVMEKHISKNIHTDIYSGQPEKRNDGIRLNSKVWREIKEDTLEFRLYISMLLEKYGLGLSFEKTGKQEMLS